MRNILLISGLLLCGVANASSTELADRINRLWQAGDYQAAQALLAPMLTKSTKDARLLALSGQTEALLQNNEQAEALLEKAVEYEPENADYQHWYATISCNLASSANMFSALGYARRCKKAYQAALTLAPDNPRSYIALASFLAQAPGIAGGDKDEAFQLAQQLKQLDELQGALLKLQLTQISDDEAFKQFLAVEKTLQSRPEPYFRRAMQVAADQNYRNAIGLLQLALQQPDVDDDTKATLAESRYQLARCAVLGKTSVTEGIAAMQQYLAEGPDSSRIEWAKLRLAQLYFLADNKAEAQEIARSLLAATADDKLKAELAKLL